MIKKAGSLTKRQYEGYMTESMSNNMCSRTSLHSKPDMIATTAWYKYDSESTSNNDYRPDTNIKVAFKKMSDQTNQ